MDNFQEPTPEQIQAYLEKHKLNRARNWWHVREILRKQLNGDPPHGFSDWGIYWKTY